MVLYRAAQCSGRTSRLLGGAGAHMASLELIETAYHEDGSAFGKLEEPVLLQALSDSQGPVRRQAILVAEHYLENSPNIKSTVMALHLDSDPKVRFQTALSLTGQIDVPAEVANACLRMSSKHADPIIQVIDGHKQHIGLSDFIGTGTPETEATDSQSQN